MRRFIFLLCLIFLSGISIFFFTQRYLPVDYQEAALSETTASLANPYRGFYDLHGYVLSEEETSDSAATWGMERFSNSPCNLILLEINLKNYSNTYLTANALEQLQQILNQASIYQKQIILRCLYDWDGNALESEPDTIEQLRAHMEQLSGVINQHIDCIFLLQGIFTGNTGEMNQTNYGSAEDITYLMQQLSGYVHPSIYLSVRTPSHLRTILMSHDPISYDEAYSGTLASRLGLYNDGMLGSDNDLGTYDDTPFQRSDIPGEKGNRVQEIDFQNKLCQYVPNGGEVVLDNTYNDLSNAISDLSAMHVSYLNQVYDPAVFEKWKNTTYEGEGVFQGCDGYTYIGEHLGYRYLITKSSLQFRPLLDNQAILSVTVQNTGFAPAYRKFDTAIYLIDQEGNKYPVKNTIDNRRITSGSDTTFRLSLDVRSMKKGTYQIYIEMTVPDSSLPVYFANQDPEEGASLLLGTITIP